MATEAAFNQLLNEWVPEELITHMFEKKMWLLDRIDKEEGWAGGPLQCKADDEVGTSVRYGKLTAEKDIDDFKYITWTLEEQKEVWGSLQWHGKDIRQHRGTGAFKLQTVLRNLPGQLDIFTTYMKEIVSINLLNRAHLTTATAAGTAKGVVKVRSINRIRKGQKISITDSDGKNKLVSGFVDEIERDASSFLLKKERGATGDATKVVDCSTVTDGSRIFLDGAEVAGSTFTSIVDQLDNTRDFFNKKRIESDKIQAINIDFVKDVEGKKDGTNILDVLFECMVGARQLGGGNPNSLVMSLNHLGAVYKAIEKSSGQYRNVGSRIDPYGFEIVEIGGVKGNMTCIGVLEKDDSEILGLDLKSLKFYTNKGFEKQVDPDGKQYYAVRNENGYKYICDIGLFGEVVCRKPCHNFMITNAQIDFAKGIFSRTAKNLGVTPTPTPTPDAEDSPPRPGSSPSPAMNALRGLRDAEKS